MHLKIPFWATVFTLLGILVLCALGTWQLHRLQWKTQIIEKMDEAYAMKPVKPLDVSGFKKGDFRYGRVEGIFLPGKALLIGPRTRDGEAGHDVIVPLKTKQGTLLVDLGWTRWELKNLPIHYYAGKRIKFEGLARIPGWNAFTPQNDPQKDLWFRADIAQIARARDMDKPLPFILYAEQASYKFDAQFPNNTRWHPDNNHLQYAVFWFAMAGVLAGVYILRFSLRRH